MSNLWNYLNSPELVFSVQRFFGVEKVVKDDKKKFRVGNSFFHYLFLLGTELGELCNIVIFFCSLIAANLRRRAVLRDFYSVLLL